MVDLSYRPVLPSDLADLTAIVGDWEVVRNLGSWPWPEDAAFTASRCCPYQGDGFVWAIIIQDRLVGTVAVTAAELGYSLRRDLWGRGIISRAACDAVHVAFATTTLDRIEASIWADNAASRSVLKKLGFRSVLTETIHAKARNVPTLSETFHLTRTEWQTLSNPAQSANRGALLGKGAVP